MDIDWTFTAIVAGAMAAMFVWICALFWWAARQHYRLIRKGYRQGITQLIVGGSAIGGPLLFAPMVISLVDGKVLSNTIENLLIITSIFVPPIIMPTVVVAVLPRRNSRRTGARPVVRFLFSATARWLERGLRCAGAMTLVIAITMLWSSTDDALRLLQFSVYLIGSCALFPYYRKRASAPALEEAVSADPRPPVLYLRPFYQESSPFTWLPKKEMGNYTASPAIEGWSGVTFEQYLSGRFTQELGPFIALGNPADMLPPEGAARRYAADDDWQQHFVSLAGGAVALVMEPNCSDNLRWEITAIKRHSWQCKLFIIIPPAQSKPYRKVYRWVYAAIRAAKRVPAPSWEKFAAELLRAGFDIDLAVPDPGSVISFDPEARAVVLIRSATRPDEFVAAVQQHLQASGASA